MSAVRAYTYYAPEDYLALERTADYKSEYIDGQIIAMAGGSRAHTAITFNLHVAIGKRILGGPCRGRSNDRGSIP